MTMLLCRGRRTTHLDLGLGALRHVVRPHLRVELALGAGLRLDLEGLRGAHTAAVSERKHTGTHATWSHGERTVEKMFASLAP